MVTNLVNVAIVMLTIALKFEKKKSEKSNFYLMTTLKQPWMKNKMFLFSVVY